MKMSHLTLLEWQDRFSTEESCHAELFTLRWPKGFMCPSCRHEKAHFLPSRRLYQCARCHHQVSVTAGTLFHATKLPLRKWFWAISLIGADKGGISALRLAKHLGVSWRTARLILKKIRIAMGHRNGLYRLRDVIEVDDAFIGGSRRGKRGRGAEGKTPILVACENRDEHAGFLAMEAVGTLTHHTVEAFVQRRLQHGQRVRSDALPALGVIGETQHYTAKVTPPSLASHWLPWVHIAIGNFKKFLNGTYHGVTRRYLQEYLDEFCYRFNRRFWEQEIPFRLLDLCLWHAPVLRS